jgi:hypothetical protein
VPAQRIFSIGWWRDEKGDPMQWHMEITDGKPLPSALTAANGTVVYRLRQVSDFTGDFSNTFIAGIVAVNVNADKTLTIEPLPGVQDPASFT